MANTVQQICSKAVSPRRKGQGPGNAAGYTQAFVAQLAQDKDNAQMVKQFGLP
jgi:hypothetical protein